MTKTSANWGGPRSPGPGKRMGPAPMPEDEKRKSVTIRLAPGTKQKAKAIAEKLELVGYGRAIDRAINLLAKELGIEL